MSTKPSGPLRTIRAIVELGADIVAPGGPGATAIGPHVPSTVEERALHILSVEHFDRTELLTAIRRTRLIGFSGAQPYADARVELVPQVDGDGLAPAQRYVLRRGVQTILELRAALLKYGIDLFALDGGLLVRTAAAPDELVPIIPPVIEESIEPDGRRLLLINDGIHRVFAARSLGLPLAVVVARGVPARYPYYALALPAGWSDVLELDELPDDFEKKSYRNPHNFKALYRDFNAQFPGIQQRASSPTPSNLRA